MPQSLNIAVAVIGIDIGILLLRGLTKSKGSDGELRQYSLGIRNDTYRWPVH